MVIQIKSDNKPILRKLRKGVDMYYIEWYLKCVKYKEQEFKAKEHHDSSDFTKCSGGKDYEIKRHRINISGH